MAESRKWTNDGENEDLLGEYLAQDPSGLTVGQLREAAQLFGLPLIEVQKIARNMSAARAEVREEYGEHF